MGEKINMKNPSKANSRGLRNNGRLEFFRYTIYDNKTDEAIIYDGNSEECAKSLGKTKSSFYCFVSRVFSGKVKRYTIIKRYSIDGEDCEEWVSDGIRLTPTRQPHSIRVRPIICLNTGKEYPSIRSAEIDTGCNHIVEVCQGKKKSTNGFMFRYSTTGVVKRQYSSYFDYVSEGCKHEKQNSVD